jgi:flagellar hook-length control protein FliK
VNAEARQIERQLIKMSTPTRPSLEGVFGGHNTVFSEGMGSLLTGGSVDVSQPELHIAEQVSYWISHDVRNADLKLKGFDDLPIDVHISMQGNDVQVDFWTDHAEIRDILRAAESHLKEMLARDGVVLAGVSVGTSRRDDQGQEGRQKQDSSRRQNVTLEVSSASVGATRPVSKSGGAIDVFV